MKIALIGYGKMGHAIERAAIARGHSVVSIIDVDSPDGFDTPEFRSADVAIEFTTPATAVDNYLKAFSRGVKVVSGTTGWTARMPEIEAYCRDNGATFFWSSNYSIGVNIFFALNCYLSAIMDDFPQYTPSMEEVHHIHKLDHPSGTAISLAGDLMGAVRRLEGWTEDAHPEPSQLFIGHRREGEVPGIHTVKWESDVDEITITHSAKSRMGFAQGAVTAAEWVATQQGFLTMDQLMHRIISNSKLLDILK